MSSINNNKRSMFGIENVTADSIDTTNLLCDTLVITTSGTAPTMPLATNTTNIATTAFVLANKGAETFQDVYDNSNTHPRPQIEISHANQALQIKGTGSIDNCLEILNTSETITASISHNGLITTALLPVCSQIPSQDDELVNKLYIDNLIVAQTFQNIYDNSTTHPRPQIEISHANEALKIKGTGSIDNCLEILNTSETITASISHNGLITTALLPLCSVVPTLNNELVNKLYVDNSIGGALDDIEATTVSTAVTMYNNLDTGSVTMGANLTTGFLRLGSNASDLIVDSGVVSMVNAELKCQNYNAIFLNGNMNIATNLVYVSPTRADLTIGNLHPYTHLRGYTTSVIGESVVTLKSNTNLVSIEGSSVNITTAGSISLVASSSTITIPNINISSSTLDISSNFIQVSPTTNICAQRAIAGAYMGNQSGVYYMWAPIFNSVSNYYDFYTPSVGSGAVTTGTSVSCDMAINDELYMIMPSYRLVVYTGIGGTLVTSLDYTNLTTCPQSIQPTGYTNQGKSCKLYFNGTLILPS